MNKDELFKIINERVNKKADKFGTMSDEPIRVNLFLSSTEVDIFLNELIDKFCDKYINFNWEIKEIETGIHDLYISCNLEI